MERIHFWENECAQQVFMVMCLLDFSSSCVEVEILGLMIVEERSRGHQRYQCGDNGH